jgi:hypothetical protein
MRPAVFLCVFAPLRENLLAACCKLQTASLRVVPKSSPDSAHALANFRLWGFYKRLP